MKSIKEIYKLNSMYKESKIKIFKLMKKLSRIWLWVWIELDLMERIFWRDRKMERNR